METNLIVMAILVIAVLLLVWRVFVLERRNSRQAMSIEEHSEIDKRYNRLLITNEKISKNYKSVDAERILYKDALDSSKKANHLLSDNREELKKDRQKILDQLNELKGVYSKELKKLESENKVLLAKCTFLESVNEEVARKKQKHRKKGEFVKEVERVLVKTGGSVSYSSMINTFKCHPSSLTYALSNLIKQGKVERVKQGIYKWNKTKNNFPDFPITL